MGNNKQNVLLLPVFKERTITESGCYFPHHPDMSGFLDVFQK